MELSSILLPWLCTAVILGETAAFGRCSPSECPSSDLTPVAQCAILSPCLEGPAVSASPSCSCADLDADGYVSLRDYAAFQIVPVRVCSRYLEVRQDPGFGFCPNPGSIYRANVVYALNGNPLLAGSLVSIGDPTVDPCIPYIIFSEDCYVVRPFPPRQLTDAEWNALTSVVQDVPPEGCPCESGCNYAIDPCVIWYIAVNLRWYNDYCYEFPWKNTEQYRQALHEVAAYLAVLATSP